MKIVGMMMARNEQWVIGASLRAALAWCDEVVVMLHACTDRTVQIVREIDVEMGGRTVIIHRDEMPWPEMALRQQMLRFARGRGATHAAIVDADEILTANLLSNVRGWVEQLKPGELLELPMIPTWRGLHCYRNDKSTWSRAYITLAVGMMSGLSYQTRNGYEFHNRPPSGSDLRNRKRPLASLGGGGVFHLQFAHWDRLMWKHTLYKMTEVIRWPGRETVAAVDRKYEQALDETDLRVSAVPPAWWESYRPLAIDLADEPWQKAEAIRLLAEHGRERFAGLRLRGIDENDCGLQIADCGLEGASR